MKGLLDNFAAAIGALTIGLLLLSVIHEYGYFWIIGGRMQSFLTTGDYFANAIVWLPLFVMLAYSVLDWGVLTDSKKVYRFGELRTRTGKILWISIAVFFPVLTFLFLGAASLWPIGIILSAWWLGYVKPTLPFATAEDDTKRYGHKLISFLPVVAVLSFIWGLTQGIGDLKNNIEPYSVVLKAGDTEDGILLRTFDKGILFREFAHKRVEFLKWDEITKLYRSAPEVWQQPVACGWFAAKSQTTFPQIAPNPSARQSAASAAPDW